MSYVGFTVLILRVKSREIRNIHLESSEHSVLFWVLFILIIITTERRAFAYAKTTVFVLREMPYCFPYFIIYYISLQFDKKARIYFVYFLPTMSRYRIAGSLNFEAPFASRCISHLLATGLRTTRDLINCIAIF